MLPISEMNLVMIYKSQVKHGRGSVAGTKEFRRYRRICRLHPRGKQSYDKFSKALVEGIRKPTIFADSISRPGFLVTRYPKFLMLAEQWRMQKIVVS